MDSPGLTRTSSLRASAGNRVYKLSLVDKVNTSTNDPQPELRQQRRNRSFRMSLAIPKAPPPVTTPEEQPSVAPDLFVSPKLPKVAKSKELPASEDATDFLTLLAAKQRRVLELREELGKAEDDLKELQKQWSAHEDRTRRSVQLQAITGGALHNPRSRTSLDNPPPQTTAVTATAPTTAGAQRASGNFGRLLAPSFPFPSPPKTAPSGRQFAPPRTSSLHDSVLTPESAKSSSDVASPSNDDFDFDDDSNDTNIPIRADEVIHMGRKLAEGINSHFWNFYEDIKQAAIGDDLVNATKPITEVRSISSLEWRRSRTSTGDSRASENDYEDDEELPSPPIRHMSSFVNSPIRTEPLGIDSPEFRGSPKYRRQGYSVLQATPAAGSSTSLIDLESEEEVTPKPAPQASGAAPRILNSNKRFSLYGPDFGLKDQSLFQ